MASTLYISKLICFCWSMTVLFFASRSFWAVLAELKKKNDIPARTIARIAKLMTAICSPCPSPRCAMTFAPAGATGSIDSPCDCSGMLRGKRALHDTCPAADDVVPPGSSEKLLVQSRYAGEECQRTGSVQSVRFRWQNG